MNLADFEDRHLGEDIYVIGSGKTLDYYAPEVFSDVITVGVNQGWSNRLPFVNYMVTKYHANAFEWAGSERLQFVVTTRGERGHHMDEIPDHDDIIVADHNENTVEKWTPAEWPEDGGLVATHSTITTAMHFAAHLGARRIFVVSADCGTLDGHMTAQGHDRKNTTLRTLQSFDRQNTMVKTELERRYNTHVIGLSPFVTPNMDGHTFVSYAGELDAR